MLCMYALVHFPIQCSYWWGICLWKVHRWSNDLHPWILHGWSEKQCIPGLLFHSVRHDLHPRMVGNTMYSRIIFPLCTPWPPSTDTPWMVRNTMCSGLEQMYCSGLVLIMRILYLDIGVDSMCCNERWCAKVRYSGGPAETLRIVATSRGRSRG